MSKYLFQTPVVFTNGVFDILHRGHVQYLEQARKLGASLIVAVNSDESARRLGKGRDRPINSLAARMAVISALRCVDLAIAFDDDTPRRLIRAFRPDILVKGGDWQDHQIAGSDDVLEGGGIVITIPFEYQTSTTSLVERIRHG